MPQPMGMLFPTDGNLSDYGALLHEELPFLQRNPRTTVRAARFRRTGQGGPSREKPGIKLCGNHFRHPGRSA